jgi:hypothetical protein
MRSWPTSCNYPKKPNKLSCRAKLGICFFRIRLEQSGGWIGPSRISFLDQRDFLDSRVRFDQLFTGDRGLSTPEGFKIHQAMNAIPFGETLVRGFSVLLDSQDEFSSHACVENPRAARQDVDAVGFLHA